MAAGETVQITMPEMGESVSEGTVLTWLKKEGDWVDKDETVVEVSTDKVDAEIPSPASGKLAKIVVGEDEVIEVGGLLGEIEVGAEAPAEAPRETRAPAAEAEAATVEEEEETFADAGGDADVVAVPDDGGKITPVARRVAAAHGIDVTKVGGSGSGGRVLKEDVLAYVERNGGEAASRDGGDGATAVAPAGDGAAAKAPPPAGAQTLRGGDAMLARYMTESLKIPTATSFRTFAVTTLDGRRRQLNEALKAAEQDFKVSFTHLIGFAIIRAMEAHPSMGHSFQEVDGKPHRIVSEHTNLGLAVDVQRDDGSRTLIVPVIKGGEAMDFARYREVYEDLIAKTRTGNMSPDDLQGATVTLTNPGGIGTVASVPRLMPGQGCIIATGAITPPPGVPDGDKVMTMTSTYDHRVIQGAESGAFLRRIEQLLQGEDSFYENVFESLGLAAPPPKKEAAPAAAAPAAAPVIAPSEELVSKDMLYHVQAATSLVKAHRMHGHLAAKLDPLGSEPLGDPALEPETVGLTPEVMVQIPAEVLRIQVAGANLAEALPALRETYCGTIAYEIEYISDHRQRVWLRQRIESGEYRRPLLPEEKLRVLRRLTEVEVLETYIHKAFLGKKSFSIEGLDVLIPMLEEVFEIASRSGAREALIGMAHRGRLNVQAHACGRPYREILAEFEGEKDRDVKTAKPKGGTGDVKYHQGLQGAFNTPSGHTLKVTLAHNPSHLEFVDPVVEGRTRADQTDRRGSEAKHDPSAALPILIHGDAAFPGEGVVAETLNLQALDGYTTGGTIHIIANNQIGFTTEPEESRSTRYASDLAKGFDDPIVHVNADDPEACIAAVRLAMAYREEFKRGVVIDLIGYRRLGHNETDEPAYTQPVMYEQIKSHPPVRKLYADSLVKAGLVTEEEVTKLLSTAHDRLSEAHEEVKLMSPVETRTDEMQLDRTRSVEPDTTMPIECLLDYNRQLFSTPDGFNVHRKLKPQRDKRLAVGPDDPIDWAHAEALAFASLLEDGVPLRLTGQDSARGTFSQRHLMLSDVETGRKYAPIQHLREAKAPFELHNSPLSEAAALGFEYGYSAAAPEALVIWEAQFGDFFNAAQVIVDQFIVAALAKWGETSRLTLLLPHGYEGAGPEHSSARIERFLTLAAEGNIRVANVSTPAQYFHLLRRQALIEKRRPLVVFTPKSLLREPRASSLLRELTTGALKRVIDDPNRSGARDQVTRLIVCSGRIYYDLTGSELYENEKVAVARVELLYPFPYEEIEDLISGYPNVKEVIWVQEEPKNAGARRFIFTRSRERSLMPEGLTLDYIGRPYRASPGEGYPAAHVYEQNRIITEALTV
jgi:2-oxoglutarate dehydrogenase E1 component